MNVETILAGKGRNVLTIAPDAVIAPEETCSDPQDLERAWDRDPAIHHTTCR